MELTRRNALQLAGLGALAVGGMALPLSNAVVAKSASLIYERLLPRPYRRPFMLPPTLNPAVTGEDQFGRYATYVINQKPATLQVLPSGQLVQGFGYDGMIPGPTVHVERGTRVVAKVRNRLPEVHPMFGHRFATSTHLHGNPSLPEYDGYASDLTLPGSSKVYQWPTEYTSARTMWYHDHAVHHTAEHAYTGLAGQFHVHDDVERALLPTGGAFDIPLTVTDVMFAADGSLGYDDRDHSGLWGDVILVNGVPWPVMPVQRRVYRFRMLNASISRSYRPTLFPGGTVHMVATDSGLMPRSREVSQWRHGSAERYEFLIDFSQYAAGTRVELRNLSNDNNRDFDNTDKIMAFDVTDDPVDTSDPTWNVIPDTLSTHEVMTFTRDMAKRRRRMEFKKTGLNGSSAPWTPLTMPQLNALREQLAAWRQTHPHLSIALLPSCSCGRTSVVVGAGGGVRTCSFSYHDVGSVRDTPLLDIWSRLGADLPESGNVGYCSGRHPAGRP